MLWTMVLSDSCT